ncbi:MAG: response regulator transcription factor [Spirochaetes bacterium]|nr:response regulator transcription factor [Spirochaetota bacterium]
MGNAHGIKGKKLRIYLVEDHPIFRQGLAQLLNSEAGMEICGEADSHLRGLQGIRETTPDFVIVDIALKDSSGVELIKDIKTYFPQMPILALSMHDENIYAERVLRAGARGYLMKQEAPETIVRAIRQILEGKVFVSDSMASRMLEVFAEGRKNIKGSPVDLLSDRELEVFRMIGEGSSTRQIAEKLHVSVKTVENHRAHIKEKLNLQSAIELIQHATLWIQGRESGEP